MDLHPSMYDDAARRRIEELQQRIHELEQRLATQLEFGHEVMNDPSTFAKHYAAYHVHMTGRTPPALTPCLTRIVDVVPTMVRRPSEN